MYDYNNAEPQRLLAKNDFPDNVTLYWLDEQRYFGGPTLLGDRWSKHL